MAELKAREIINIHAHHHRNRDFDEHVAQWKAEGALRTCVSALGEDEWTEDDSGHFSNADLLPYLHKHPDHVIGMACIRTNPEPEGADAVKRRHGEGFRGLKLIDPCAPYDDERFFPIYERA